MTDVTRAFAIALLLGGIVHPRAGATTAGQAAPASPADACRPAANRGFVRIGCCVVVPPVVIRRSAPKLDKVKTPYPTGTAILEVGVSEKGQVVSVCVLRSVRPDFDRAAQDAMSRWLFKPAMLRGQPVGNVLTMTMAVPDHEVKR